MSRGKIINVQWLIQANSNDNVKVPHHWPCVEKPPKTRGFPLQRPVMKKAFLCRDDIINRGGEISGMPTIRRNWQRFIYHHMDQTDYWSFWNYWHCRSIWKTALRFNPNIVFLKLHWGWNMAKNAPWCIQDVWNWNTSLLFNQYRLFSTMLYHTVLSRNYAYHLFRKHH